MSREGAFGNGGLLVLYRCKRIAFIVALGGGMDPKRVVTALVSMVAMTSIMVDAPVCVNFQRFCARVETMRAELALLAVCVRYETGSVEESVVVPFFDRGQLVGWKCFTGGSP